MGLVIKPLKQPQRIDRARITVHRIHPNDFTESLRGIHDQECIEVSGIELEWRCHVLRNGQSSKLIRGRT